MRVRVSILLSTLSLLRRRPCAQAPRHPGTSGTQARSSAPASSWSPSTSPRSTTTAGRSPTSPPAELEVEIDGNKRQVSTVEYIRSADPLRVIGAPHKVVVADETFSSSNAKGAPRGRLIVLLIDQGNIRTGAARSSMNSAKKFVDTLTPEDRVSVIAVPGPGELVDFTTDHDKVREALLRVVGTRRCAEVALQPVDHRGDGDLPPLRRADGDRSDPARVRAAPARRRSSSAASARSNRTPPKSSTRSAIARRTRSTACARCCRAWPESKGPKSVILISEGLIFEGLGSETDELASIAADSRASLDVLLLDVPQFDASQSRAPDHAARGSRSAGDRPRDARRRVARIALSHQRHRRFRVRSHLAIARRLLPARRRVAARGSQRPAASHRRQERCGAA